MKDKKLLPVVVVFVGLSAIFIVVAFIGPPLFALWVAAGTITFVVVLLLVTAAFSPWIDRYGFIVVEAVEPREPTSREYKRLFRELEGIVKDPHTSYDDVRWFFPTDDRDD